MFIEQTKTKSQETLEFKMKKEMQTFRFYHQKKLIEGGNWLLVVTSFGAANSLFHITDENNSFPYSTPSHWNCEGGEDFNNKLHRLLELRSESDIDLHVKNGKKERSTRL